MNNETISILQDGRPTTVIIGGTYHGFRYYYYVFAYDNQLNIKAVAKNRVKDKALQNALDELKWNLRFLNDWDLVPKEHVPILSERDIVPNTDEFKE